MSKFDFSGFHFLIVDDEPDLREIIVDEIKDYHGTFCEAGGGFAAFELFEKQKFDCVISDIRMLDGTGIELLDLIRTKNTTVPVILISGFADISEEEALNKGATAIFSKPFKTLKLMEFIESHLTKKSA
jgi:CheY-like chemotaxis protein